MCSGIKVLRWCPQNRMPVWGHLGMFIRNTPPRLIEGVLALRRTRSLCRVVWSGSTRFSGRSCFHRGHSWLQRLLTSTVPVDRCDGLIRKVYHHFFVLPFVYFEVCRSLDSGIGSHQPFHSEQHAGVTWEFTQPVCKRMCVQA